MSLCLCLSLSLVVVRSSPTPPGEDSWSKRVRSTRRLFHGLFRWPKLHFAVPVQSYLSVQYIHYVPYDFCFPSTTKGWKPCTQFLFVPCPPLCSTIAKAIGSCSPRDAVCDAPWMMQHTVWLHYHIALVFFVTYYLDGLHFSLFVLIERRMKQSYEQFARKVTAN